MEKEKKSFFYLSFLGYIFFINDIYILIINLPYLNCTVTDKYGSQAVLRTAFSTLCQALELRISFTFNIVEQNNNIRFLVLKKHSAAVILYIESRSETCLAAKLTYKRIVSISDSLPRR